MASRPAPLMPGMTEPISLTHQVKILTGNIILDTLQLTLSTCITLKDFAYHEHSVTITDAGQIEDLVADIRVNRMDSTPIDRLVVVDGVSTWEVGYGHHRMNKNGDIVHVEYSEKSCRIYITQCMAWQALCHPTWAGESFLQWLKDVTLKIMQKATDPRLLTSSLSASSASSKRTPPATCPYSIKLKNLILTYVSTEGKNKARLDAQAAADATLRAKAGPVGPPPPPPIRYYQLHLDGPRSAWAFDNMCNAVYDPARVPVTTRHIVADVGKFIQGRASYTLSHRRYNRKYLLHGPPGCGKTQAVEIVAHIFALPIFVVRLTDPDMTDAILANLMRHANEFPDPADHYIIIIDEIDKAIRNIDRIKGLTRGGILSAIDGYPRLPGNGCLLMMTANDVTFLNDDPELAAMNRGGRIDVMCAYTQPISVSILNMVDNRVVGKEPVLPPLFPPENSTVSPLFRGQRTGDQTVTPGPGLDADSAPLISAARASAPQGAGSSRTSNRAAPSGTGRGSSYIWALTAVVDFEVALIVVVVAIIVLLVIAR